MYASIRPCATLLRQRRWCQLPSELPNFDRAAFEDTCKRRFIYGASFDCYGGVGGLYDFGPVGCAIKTNFIQLWRQHFILEENMLEVDTSCLTPGEVFNTSGHTERFTDVMVKDMVTGELLRVDKYIEEWVGKKLTDKHSKDLTAEQKSDLKQLGLMADGMPIDELRAELKKWDVKSAAGNTLSEPEFFNLMFPTPIGPAGDRQGFMRPELAQGIILNFNRLLEFNGGRMPFAGAAIGSAFRNEIAPRNNLLRVREFTLAEIEHFQNPNDTSCEKFANVADLRVHLWSREMQATKKDAEIMSLREAMDAGIITNETLGYFLGRAILFTQGIGMKYIRFRQHRANEMAHYAKDCWDCECLSSFGWVECIGIADRSCYDLECHGKERKTNFFAYEKYKEPRMVTVLERKLEKTIAKKFTKNTAKVTAYLNGLSQEDALALHQKLDESSPVECEVEAGLKLEIERSHVSFKMVEKKEEGYNYTPSVIEPSFGVGRLIYTLLEQTYYVRKAEESETPAPAAEEGGKKKNKKSKDDKNEKRAVWALPAKMCPYKVAVMPLSPTVFREQYCTDIIAKLRTAFVPLGISYKVDDGSQTIGKKYARTDEIGVPFGITIDPDAATTGELTLRERDSMEQVYIPIEEVAATVEDLCQHRVEWSEVATRFRRRV